MGRIFISHSSRNNAEAIALNQWLNDEGWDDLFLDLDPERGIVAGERWERALNEAAKRCEAVVFLVSRDWLASAWCRRELYLADKLNKRLFGVLIEDMPIAEVPGEIRDHFQLVDLTAGRDHKLFSAALPDGHEQHVTFSETGLARLRAGLTRAGLDAKHFAWPPDTDPERPPYRGLRPLEAEDAGIFFGREAPTIEAMDRLRGLRDAPPPRLFVILGASGAGKSSFLRAGLLPRLQRDDRHFVPLPPMRPERAALNGETGFMHCLEAALKGASVKRSRAEVKAAIRAGAPQVRALLDELTEALRPPALDDTEHAAPAAPARLVLAVDQGEELFLSEGAEEAQAFLEMIRDLALHPASNLIVLVTIRSDSFEYLQTARPLDGISPHTFSLPPLPRGAYQTVIEGPAARLRDSRRPLKLEPALTAALLGDIEAGGGKDALPLLAFTLERLYLEHGGDGDLKLSEYHEIGGIRGSIEAAVEGALKRADSDPALPRDRAARLALLRRALIPWLAGIDPETGAPRRRVARLAEIPEEARPLVDHLVATRLLATDVSPDSGERTVEPAHEALLRQWALLDGWLEEDFAALATLEGVKRAAREWEANDRDEAWLAHSAGRLEDAEAVRTRDDLAGLVAAAERNYLDACREAETARRAKELEATRRQVRLQRRLVLVSSFAAVVFAVIGGFAALQWNEANKARTAAESALRTATGAANRMVLDLAQRFKRASVPAEITRSILEEARALQNTLTKNFPADAGLQSSRSVALTELGDVYALQGDLDEALDAHEESLRVSRNLALRDNASSQWQRDVSVSLNKIGDVKLRTGDSAGAFQAYEESFAISRALAVGDETDSQWQRDLAVSLSKIGKAKLHIGDSIGALEAFEESLAISRVLVARDDANPGWQRDVSVALNDIGHLYRRAGDASKAMDAFEESLAISRTLAARDKTNTGLQRDIGTNLDLIGDMKLRAGDPAGALENYEQALEVGRTLAARDETNTELQRDISVSYNKIGDAKLRIGGAAEALEAYQQSLAVARNLVTRDETNRQWQHDLSTSLNNSGHAKLRLGDAAGAIDAYEESVGIRSALVASDATNASWQHDLSVSLMNLGDAKLKAGDTSGALEAYDSALQVRRTLTDRYGVDVQRQRGIAAALAKVGDIKRQIGDAAGALEAYEESVDIGRSIGTRDDGDILWKRDNSVTLNRIGDGRLQNADTAAALEAYDEALKIRRALAADDTENAQWQRDVAVSLNRIGGVKLRIADVTGAIESYQESLNILQSLTAHEETSAKRQVGISDGISIAKSGLAAAKGSHSYYALLNRSFIEAEIRSREALALDPSQLWLNTNLAHALMFQGKLSAADELYLGLRGERVGDSKWEEVVLDDFRALRDTGLSHEHMDDIEAEFAGRAD